MSWLRPNFTPHRSGGYTLIELLEAIAAIALGGWMADRLSRHFEGLWHKIVYWSVATVGSGVLFVIFLFGFGYLLDYLKKKEKSKLSCDRAKTKVD